MSIKIRAKSVMKMETPQTNLTTEWHKGTPLRDVAVWLLGLYLTSIGWREGHGKAEKYLVDMEKDSGL